MLSQRLCPLFNSIIQLHTSALSSIKIEGHFKRRSCFGGNENLAPDS